VSTESAADPTTSEPSSEAQSAQNDPLAEAEAKAAALKDQLLRTAADFDNYRKRSRREIEDANASGRDVLLRELLPVFDNLERATAHTDKTDLTAIVSGIEMVLRQFRDTLKRIGIERIETVGKAFDPALHEALQQIETAEFQPGQIAAEIQGGYRYGERLVRPAMVVVAKTPAAPKE
jgi:molecular chaperone GrpE